MPYINGTATFTENSRNYGNVSTAFFTDSARNVGEVATAAFSNTTTNEGTVSNAEFYTDSINLSVVQNAVFYDSSINDGDVVNNALFTNTAVNSGSAASATFIGDAVNKGDVDSGAYETPDSDQGNTQTVLPLIVTAPTFTNVISSFIVVVMVKDKVTSITAPTVTTTSYVASTDAEGYPLYDDNGEPEYTALVTVTSGETYTNDVATTYMYAGSSCIDAIYACKFTDALNLSSQNPPTNTFSSVFNTIGFRESFLQQVSSGDTSPLTQYDIMLDDQSGVDYDKYNDFIFDLITNFCVDKCFRHPTTVLSGVTTTDFATQIAEENDGVYSLTTAWPYMPANTDIRNAVKGFLQTTNFTNPLPSSPLSDENISAGVDDAFYRTARLFARSRTDQAGVAYAGEFSSSDELVDGTLDFYYSLGSELFGKLPKRSYIKRAIGAANLNIPLNGACSENAYPPFDNGGAPPTTFTQTWAGEDTWTGNLTVTAIGYVVEIDIDSLVYVQTNY